MTCARNVVSGIRLGALVVAVLAVLVVPPLAGGATVDVTACGQTVLRGSTGVLVADLNCSLQYGSYAVLLANGATLRLNGFAVRSSANGVKCLGRCRIIGPGELARTEPSCDQEGILDAYGVFGNDAVTLQSVTLTSWGFATWASGRLRATAVQVNGHCDGLVGNTARIVVRDSTITNNVGLGVACSGGASISRSTVTGNFIDVSAARRPRLRATTCGTSGGGPGSPPDTWAVCTAP